MKVCYDKCGSQLRSLCEYPIDRERDIRRGQVVCIRQGRVVLAQRRQEGAVLGIAGEDHTGKADVFCPRSNGGSILVYDSPTAVCECPAPELTVTAGGIGCLRVGEGLHLPRPDALMGATVIPVGRGDCAFLVQHACEGELELCSPHTFCEGERVCILPPVLFCGGVLDAARSALSLDDSCGLSYRVVGTDSARRRVFLMARRHAFAAGNDL